MVTKPKSHQVIKGTVDDLTNMEAKFQEMLNTALQTQQEKYNQTIKDLQAQIKTQQEQVEHKPVALKKAVDLGMLKSAILHNQVQSSKNISISKETILENGLPKEVDIVSIITPHRQTEVVKVLLNSGVILAHPDFAQTFADYFATKYESIKEAQKLHLVGDNEQEVQEVLSMLVSRGIYTNAHLAHTRRSTLQNLIEPIYGIAKYLSVLQYVKDIVCNS